VTIHLRGDELPVFQKYFESSFSLVSQMFRRLPDFCSQNHEDGSPQTHLRRGIQHIDAFSVPYRLPGHTTHLSLAYLECVEFHRVHVANTVVAMPDPLAR